MPATKQANMPAPMRRKDGTTLYWAYGSNLDKQAMLHRCPAAKPQYALHLNDCQLTFRGVADVVYHRHAICPGAVWSISKECEKALDRYEGVAGGMYAKRYFHLKMKSGLWRPVLYYKMREQGICPPSTHYLQVIQNGYDDFGLDIGFLEEAVNRAWDNAQVTHGIRKRYNRKGYVQEFGHACDLGNGK
jgi:hypothetical protein